MLIFWANGHRYANTCTGVKSYRLKCSCENRCRFAPCLALHPLPSVPSLPSPVARNKQFPALILFLYPALPIYTLRYTAASCSLSNCCHLRFVSGGKANEEGKCQGMERSILNWRRRQILNCLKCLSVAAISIYYYRPAMSFQKALLGARCSLSQEEWTLSKLVSSAWHPEMCSLLELHRGKMPEWEIDPVKQNLLENSFSKFVKPVKDILKMWNTEGIARTGMQCPVCTKFSCRD